MTTSTSNLLLKLLKIGWRDIKQSRSKFKGLIFEGSDHTPDAFLTCGWSGHHSQEVIFLANNEKSLYQLGGWLTEKAMAYAET